MLKKKAVKKINAALRIMEKKAKKREAKSIPLAGENAQHVGVSQLESNLRAQLDIEKNASKVFHGLWVKERVKLEQLRVVDDDLLAKQRDTLVQLRKVISQAENVVSALLNINAQDRHTPWIRDEYIDVTYHWDALINSAKSLQLNIQGTKRSVIDDGRLPEAHVKPFGPTELISPLKTFGPVA